MPRVIKKVRCSICGRPDNDWKERGGLCLECYCKKLSKHIFDNIEEGRHPTLEEASVIIKKELNENHRLSAL